MAQPALITLTAPTCSGKSHLLNYIRETIPGSCLVSTTTRAPRAGEKSGTDYYYITDAESRKIESKGGFAELVIYSGARYGVTKNELMEKLSSGLAFVIVEPSGVETYKQIAASVNAKHLKFFIDTPEEVRLERMFKRLTKDLDLAVDTESAKRVSLTHFKRMISMVTVERGWGAETLGLYDGVLDGRAEPSVLLSQILRKVESFQC